MSSHPGDNPLFFSTFPVTPEVFYPHRTESYTSRSCVNVPGKATNIFHRISDSVPQAAAYHDLLWCTGRTADNTGMYSSDKKADECCFSLVETPVDNRRIPIHICGYEILSPENPGKIPHSDCCAEIMRYLRIYISSADLFSVY